MRFTKLFAVFILLAALLSSKPIRDSNGMLKRELWEGKEKGIAQTAVALGTAAIIIIIVMFIWAQLTDALPEVNNTIYNDTKDDVDANIGTAMTLIAVGLIVAAAVYILRLVTTGLGGGRMD